MMIVTAHAKHVRHAMQAEEVLDDSGNPTGRTFFTDGKSYSPKQCVGDYVDETHEGELVYVTIKRTEKGHTLVTTLFTDGTVKECTSGGVDVVTKDVLWGKFEHTTNDELPIWDHNDMTISAPAEQAEDMKKILAEGPGDRAYIYWNASIDNNFAIAYPQGDQMTIVRSKR